MLSKIVNDFFSHMQKIRNWKINRLLKEIEDEKDIIKKYEKEIIYKIQGVSMGGMAGSTAYCNFKDEYYNNIVDESVKSLVNKAILNILESKQHSMKMKAMVSYACADIKFKEALNIIEKLNAEAKKGSQELNLLVRSLDALKNDKSISEMTYDVLKDRGEL